MKQQQSKTEPQQKKEKKKKEAGRSLGRVGLNVRTCLAGRGLWEARLRLRTHAARGSPRGWRFRPRIPAFLLGPERAGDMLAMFPSYPLKISPDPH